MLNKRIFPQAPTGEGLTSPVWAELVKMSGATIEN
jgi:hypothetical protein